MIKFPVCHFNPHTPRGVRPDHNDIHKTPPDNFNPHTPRGVRLHHKVDGLYDIEFQSTHPARGATPPSLRRRQLLGISIHAPREGCDYLLQRHTRLVPISIHAPREGCDLAGGNDGGHRNISIHAPREGCDMPLQIQAHLHFLFQSTHPARGATPEQAVPPRWLGFQSTHPARGATSSQGRWLIRH